MANLPNLKTLGEIVNSGLVAENKKDFLEKLEAYTDAAIGNELHRQNVYHVRINDV